MENLEKLLYDSKLILKLWLDWDLAFMCHEISSWWKRLNLYTNLEKSSTPFIIQTLTNVITKFSYHKLILFWNLTNSIGKRWPRIFQFRQIPTAVFNCFQLFSTVFNCFQLWATANNCEQLRTTANNWEQLGTTVNNCEQLRTTASNWEQLGTTGNNWEHLGTTGNSWEQLGANF